MLLYELVSASRVEGADMSDRVVSIPQTGFNVKVA